MKEETDQQWRERMRRRNEELDRIFKEEAEAGRLVTTREDFEQACREEYGVGGRELFFPPKS